jgi:hypothetical protein
MTPRIRITRIPYEEPYHLRLVMRASNGSQRTEIKFYVNRMRSLTGPTTSKFSQDTAPTCFFGKRAQNDRRIGSHTTPASECSSTTVLGIARFSCGSITIETYPIARLQNSASELNRRRSTAWVVCVKDSQS